MLSTNNAAAILAVDLGKTHTRARHLRGDRVIADGQAPGDLGLAGPDAVAHVVHAIEAAARTAGLGGGARVDVLAAGLAGYASAPELREPLAVRLRQRWGGAVVLCSDVTSTHAGALRGGPGVVVAAGTGAVALGVTGHAHAVRDGWGPLLGDEGSGAAVGRAGLRAALAFAEGRGGSAVLAAAAEARFGALAGLPAAVHGAPDPTRLVASFARDVARAAREGDALSQEIWRAAAASLAATALACRDALDAGPDPGPDPGLPVALSGGLLDAGDVLTAPFVAAVEAGGGRVVPATGTSLDGAALLATAVLADGAPPAALADLVGVWPAEGSSRERAGGAAAHPGAGGRHGASHDASDLSRLDTEGARADLADLDRRPTRDVLTELWRAEAEVPRALLALTPAVAAAADAAAARLRAGGRMFYVGAGTPARLAFVDASELPPTFGTPHELVQALTAGGPDAVLQAREGAEDDGPAGARAIGDAAVGPSDVVVGLSASGRTPFVVAALRVARERGALTISLANNPDAEVSALADHPVEVLTGAEVISGSTRLKAGTAQKLFLNGLSTAVMIRLGKTYGPYMVDMRATNHKLRVRAERMVRRVTGAEADDARRALLAADWSTTVAIVMILRGLDAAVARATLERHGGSVRAALESTPVGRAER